MMYGVLSIYNFDNSVPSIKLTIEKFRPEKNSFTASVVNFLPMSPKLPKTFPNEAKAVTYDERLKMKRDTQQKAVFF